jgi:uncharacterized glyoxalase superfamily protein PhnB
MSLPQIEFITPILNVSDVPASLRWFEQLGWSRTFTWNSAGVIEDKADRDDNGVADFAGIGSGNVQIFLCLDAQGARGGPLPQHVTGKADETGGCWISLWVSSTDALKTLYDEAKSCEMEIILDLTDQPWGSREFRLLHPDGHTLRINAVL